MIIREIKSAVMDDYIGKKKKNTIAHQVTGQRSLQFE